MTARELMERMDAPELMEWVAYYKLQDKEEYAKLEMEVESEKSPAYHAERLRSFLQTIRPSKK